MNCRNCFGHSTLKAQDNDDHPSILKLILQSQLFNVRISIINLAMSLAVEILAYQLCCNNFRLFQKILKAMSPTTRRLEKWAPASGFQRFLPCRTDEERLISPRSRHPPLLSTTVWGLQLLDGLSVINLGRTRGTFYPLTELSSWVPSNRTG